LKALVVHAEIAQLVDGHLADHPLGVIELEDAEKVFALIHDFLSYAITGFTSW
jgi:hypothetical protein